MDEFVDAGVYRCICRVILEYPEARVSEFGRTENSEVNGRSSRRNFNFGFGGS